MPHCVKRIGIVCRLHSAALASNCNEKAECTRSRVLCDREAQQHHDIYRHVQGACARRMPDK
jgi:hypothetical protein